MLVPTASVVGWVEQTQPLAPPPAIAWMTLLLAELMSLTVALDRRDVSDFNLGIVRYMYNLYGQGASMLSPNPVNQIAYSESHFTCPGNQGMDASGLPRLEEPRCGGQESPTHAH